MKTSLLLAVSCLILTHAQAQENTQPTLFVAPFKADSRAVVDWQPAMGDGLAEMFITEIVEVFEVVEEKDDQGQVVFSEEKLAGEMMLESVQADRSRGKCLNGLAPQKGWMVKRKTNLAMK